MLDNSSLETADAADFLLGTLQTSHKREPFVGGLFNAYEKALHYELFNAALARGLHDTWQEARFGPGQARCELVLPLVDDARLWVELKMWWSLHEAYPFKYRTWQSPLEDWMRLSGQQHRAVLLLRIWDGAKGSKDLERPFVELKQAMAREGAPEPRVQPLLPRPYAGKHQHTRQGDMVLWSSTDAGRSAIE